VTFFPAAADNVRLLFIGTTFPVFRAFADRAFGTTAIRARRAENLCAFLPLTYVLPKAVIAAVIPDSSLSNRSSSFFNKRKTASTTDIEFASL